MRRPLLAVLIFAIFAGLIASACAGLGSAALPREGQHLPDAHLRDLGSPHRLRVCTSRPRIGGATGGAF